MWTIISQVAWGLIKFLMARSANKDKAEKQFSKIVSKMDEYAKRDADRKKKYDEIKARLIAIEEAEKKEKEDKLKKPT